MELVIASIALANGFIDQKLFSILVLMGTLTTLVTPTFLKYAFQQSGIQHDPSPTEDRATEPPDPQWVSLPSPESNAINDPPIANPDRKFTRQNTTLIFPSSDLTANDVDLDGDTLTVTAVIVNDETHGTVRLADHQITYQPDPRFNGSASFGYVVSDRRGETAIGTVHVRVIP